LTRDRAVRKYLSAHAQAEVGQRVALSRRYHHVACIPACDEVDSLPETLRTLARALDADAAVVIVVINGRVDAAPAIHEANQACARNLREAANLPEAPMAEGRLGPMGIVLVDRFTHARRLPEKRGVGLARKIAADLALSWMDDGAIEDRWIRCTDADVRVPPDYWRRPLQRASGQAAAVYPFVHVPEGDALQRQALAYYDAYLRYYVRGLEQAGSRYAFHTIGSLLAIQADAYAKVRGFPKRLAGEDFYILNKLAKIGCVQTLTGQPIQLRGRTSARVPYGTGVAVAQIRQRLAQGAPYEVYAPRIFAALKHWLDVLEEACEHGDASRFHHALDAVPPPLGPIVRRAVARTGSRAPVERALQEVSGAVLRKRIDDWNDAFRTLKMVHALRDEGLGMAPADEVVAPFMSARTATAAGP